MLTPARTVCSMLLENVPSPSWAGGWGEVGSLVPLRWLCTRRPSLRQGLVRRGLAWSLVVHPVSRALPGEQRDGEDQPVGFPEAYVSPGLGEGEFGFRFLSLMLMVRVVLFFIYFSEDFFF